MTKLAKLLRAIANRIDDSGDPFRDLSVAAMNRYIGRTEAYVIALEARAKAAGVPDEEIAALRGFNGRFDTSRLMNAGSWPLEINMGQKLRRLSVEVAEGFTRSFEGVIFAELKTIRGNGLPGRDTHTITFVADLER